MTTPTQTNRPWCRFMFMTPIRRIASRRAPRHRRWLRFAPLAAVAVAAVAVAAAAVAAVVEAAAVAAAAVGGAPTIQTPNYTFQTPQGALVQVKLQIEQSAVIARDAFNATLQLVNNAGATISNLSVTITVYDASNNVANSLFGIPAPHLDGLNAVDGTGVLDNGATGTADLDHRPGHQCRAAQRRR